MKKHFFGILFIWLISSVAILSQNKYEFNELDEYIKNAVDSFEVPGLAVGIIKNGNIVFAEGYGVKSTITNSKVDTETLFGIASLSKAFTAACIGMLVDEEKIHWDDRVIDHLPWFKLYDPYITRELRIVDLLSHRSGLATFDGDLLWYGSNHTRDEIVRRIRELPIKNSFRERYGYQNVMFIVAGELIKEVAGKTWDQFINERIFKPLQMNSSTVTNSIFDESYNIAIPHLKGEVQEFINYDNCGPAASINSCIVDMLKWTKFWINKGMVDTSSILSEKSYYAITKSYMGINAGKGEKIGGTHFVNTGLGWFLSDYAGRKILTHGGGLPGFLSRITVVPEDSLGIVVLQNDMQPVYKDVAKKILDFMLKVEGEDYVAKSLVNKDKIEESRKRKKQEILECRIINTDPSYELSVYAGKYQDKMYGDAEIKISNDELFVSLIPTQKLFNSKLEHWHFDTFKIKFNDPFLPQGFITFHKNSKGEITNFTIDLPNPDFHFYNLDFVKQ